MAVAGTAGALLVAAPAVAAAASLPAECVQSGSVVRCSYVFTGGEQSFTVPAGVNGIHVVAIGAAGGVNPQAGIPKAGRGAQVSGDLPVYGGEILYLEVGGTPTHGSPCPAADDANCIGGFNGGGSTTTTPDPTTGPRGGGGGGGGASDLRTIPAAQSHTLSSRVLVAAGGGGQGQDAGGTCQGTDGGAGGDAGADGRIASACNISGTDGGTAGTDIAGGAGGFLSTLRMPSNNGGYGRGGDGQGGGGGGGAGLFGGGGGGGPRDTSSSAPGSGAGGGSSLEPPGGTVTVITNPVTLSPDPATITLTYTPPDTTPPVITPTVTGTAGANGWYTSDVGVSWSVADGESAVTSKTGCDPASVTTDTDGLTFTCTAVSAGGSTTQPVTVKRDATAPAITVTGGPADGAHYYPGRVPAVPTCTATDATSKVNADGCAVTGYTVALGAHTLAFTATDNAGNTATQTRAYTVDADTSAPDITPTITGTLGANGWYTSDATLTWTVTDDQTDITNQVGCDPVTVDSDTDAPVDADGRRFLCIATSGGGTASQVVMIKRDTLPPAIAVASGPADGAHYYPGRVPAAPTCAATDTTSGVNADGCTVTGYATGLGAHTLTFTATDNAGNTTTGTRTYTVDADTSGPDITPTITGTTNAAGWYTTDASLTWTVTDDQTDITTKTGCDTAAVTTDTTGQTFTCTASSGGGTTTSSVTIKRDTTAPTITITGGPAAGSTFVYGSTPAAPTCTATDVTSQVNPAGCQVDGYSTAVGTHTLTFTATDNAGNTTKSTRSYTVSPWTLKGFYKPVDMAPVVNTVKGGSSVALKFNVYAGSTELTTPAAIGATFTATAGNCTTGTQDPVDLTTTGATTLTYTGGQFQQTWKTPKTPGTCYTITLTTKDGTALTAFFQLK